MFSRWTCKKRAGNPWAAPTTSTLSVQEESRKSLSSANNINIERARREQEIPEQRQQHQHWENKKRAGNPWAVPTTSTLREQEESRKSLSSANNINTEGTRREQEIPEQRQQHQHWGNKKRAGNPWAAPTTSTQREQEESRKSLSSANNINTEGTRREQEIPEQRQQHQHWTCKKRAENPWATPTTSTLREQEESRKSLSSANNINTEGARREQEIPEQCQQHQHWACKKRAENPWAAPTTSTLSVQEESRKSLSSANNINTEGTRREQKIPEQCQQHQHWACKKRAENPWAVPTTSTLREQEESRKSLSSANNINTERARREQKILEQCQQHQHWACKKRAENPWAVPTTSILREQEESRKSLSSANNIDTEGTRREQEILEQCQQHRHWGNKKESRKSLSSANNINTKRARREQEILEQCQQHQYWGNKKRAGNPWAVPTTSTLREQEESRKSLSSANNIDTEGTREESRKSLSSANNINTKRARREQEILEQCQQHRHWGNKKRAGNPWAVPTTSTLRKQEKRAGNPWAVPTTLTLRKQEKRAGNPWAVPTTSTLREQEKKAGNPWAVPTTLTLREQEKRAGNPWAVPTTLTPREQEKRAENPWAVPTTSTGSKERAGKSPISANNIDREQRESRKSLSNG